MDATVYLLNNPVTELTYLLNKFGRDKLEKTMFPVTGTLDKVPEEMQTELFKTYGRIEIIAQDEFGFFAKDVVRKKYYYLSDLKSLYTNKKYRSLAWKYVRIQLEEFLKIYENRDVKFADKVQQFSDILLESEFKILNTDRIILQPDIDTVIDTSEPKIDMTKYLVLTPEILKGFKGKVYYIRTNLDGYIENDYESYFLTKGNYERWLDSGLVPLQYDSGQVDRKGHGTKFDALKICNDGTVTSDCNEYLYFEKKLLK